MEEVVDDLKRYSEIADRYVQMAPEARSDTLIVTGTNKSRNIINQLVHEGLGLSGTGFNFTLLTRVDTTQAQRRSARYFQVGNIIQPERNYQVGLEQDKQYRVTSVDTARNRLCVVDVVTGENITFNPARATKLSVYERFTTELSVGEKVRVTRNDAKLDLRNGDRYEVLSVTPTTVKIGVRDANGQVTKSTLLSGGSTNDLHLDLAYVTTVHASQGLSATGVLLNQETYSRTTKADVFYVAISRAREWVTVFTNDITKLPGAVSRRENKSAALDIGIAHGRHEAMVSKGHERERTDSLSL